MFEEPHVTGNFLSAGSSLFFGKLLFLTDPLSILRLSNKSQPILENIIKEKL